MKISTKLPSSKYFSDRSKAVLLLWIFYVFSVLCLLWLCARLFICVLWSPAGKGLTSWLSIVVSNCEFVTFPLVSWVRCGTWLYRFLIFAPLLTLYIHWATIKIMPIAILLKCLRFSPAIHWCHGCCYCTNNTCKKSWHTMEIVNTTCVMDF